MNMLKGRLETGARTGLAADNGIFVPLAPSPAYDGLAGRPLVIGIRPEHLRIVGSDGDGFEVTAKIVEPTGSETQVTALAGGAEMIALFRERQTIRQGDTLRLGALHHHLFDAESGARLASASA
jgi:multiple sugar transport system ATP-binding protein